jgi:hypothetical protein
VVPSTRDHIWAILRHAVTICDRIGQKWGYAVTICDRIGQKWGYAVTNCDRLGIKRIYT